MVSTKPVRKPSRDGFRQRLRRELLQLLRQEPAFRQELETILGDIFPSRAEIAELRALREDFQRFAAEIVRRFEAMDRRFEAMEGRFEAMDRRFEAMEGRFEAMDRRFEAMEGRFEAIDHHFEAMDRRFEAILGELRTQQLHLSGLSGRLGYGLEYLVRGVVEEFAGKALSRSERLILKDPEGEVFGVPADIEFDLLASDGEVYLCEVKSHIEPDDVLRFHRKAEFAAKHIARPFSRVMIGTSMETKAEKLMESLSIRPIVRARIEE